MSSNKAAWIKSRMAKPFEIGDAPMYEPGPGEILMKNHVVAINPADWKVQDLEPASNLVQSYPWIFGCDAAGEVVSVGSGVSSFKPGDRVTTAFGGMVNNKIGHNAFQLYSTTIPNLTSRVPDNVSLKDASVLSIGIATAASGLYQKELMGLRPLPSPTPPPVSDDSDVILVWGGSSSVGSAAIQLARASGYRVAATASKKNHALCKELGAEWLFDYKEEDVVDQIVKALQGKRFMGVYEAIGSEENIRLSAEVADKLGGNGRKYVLIVIPGYQVEGLPADVETGYAYCTAIADDEVGPAVFGKYVYEALANGSLKCKPDPVVAGQGIESIQAAVQRLKDGVSAQKLVVELV